MTASMSLQDAARLVLDPVSSWLPEDPAYDTPCSAAVRLLAQNALGRPLVSFVYRGSASWVCGYDEGVVVGRETERREQEAKRAASSPASAATPEHPKPMFSTSDGCPVWSAMPTSSVRVCRVDDDTISVTAGKCTNNIEGLIAALRAAEAYRAPEPPKALSVGDKLHDADDLRRAGVGAAIRQADGTRGLVCGRNGKPGSVAFEDGRTCTLDMPDLDWPATASWPMTVVDLPGGDPS